MQLRSYSSKPDDQVPGAERSCIAAAKQFCTDGVDQVGRRRLPGTTSLRTKEPTLDDAFIELVNRHLPSQPWKPAVHSRLAQQLHAKVAKVSAAIQLLIKQGKGMEQRDGIVYKDGKVVAVDHERVRQGPGDVKSDPVV